MKPDRFPLPKIQEIFDKLGGGENFTTLDFFSGYWQIRMSDACKKKRTIVCRFETFQFEVMPFGLMNAPSTLQRMMDQLMGDIPFVKVYLDDVVIFSKTMAEHIEHLRLVIGLVSQHGLKIKISKCEFAKETVSLPGHIVGKEGTYVDPSKIAVIRDTPTPKSQTELRSFLGIARYYRRFIPSFADISAPLHCATSVKTQFSWRPDMEKTFNRLKESLTEPPVLAFPDFENPFVVETDASAVAIRAVLSQRKTDSQLHPFQYASRTMTSSERQYSACEREALAVIFALRKFRLYLLSSNPFTLLTDQKALRSAFAKKDVHGRLARWLDFIAEYDFEIEYRNGSSNKAADFLSRIQHGEEVVGGFDEGEVMCVLVESQTREDLAADLEPTLQEIAWHLSGWPLAELCSNQKASVRRRSVEFVRWEGRLYRRSRNRPLAIVPRAEKQGVLKALHDDLEHWEAATTHTLVADRFCWPGVRGDVATYARTCDTCQRSRNPKPYKTVIRILQSSLFDVFSTYFAGPLPVTSQGSKYLLICVEHLTGWPIVKATSRATADVVRKFMETLIIPPFGPPGVVVGDSAACFTAGALREFMKYRVTTRKTVLAYAPMLNGRTERMVDTIKHGAGPLILQSGHEWDFLVW